MSCYKIVTKWLREEDGIELTEPYDDIEVHHDLDKVGVIWVEHTEGVYKKATISVCKDCGVVVMKKEV